MSAAQIEEKYRVMAIPAHRQAAATLFSCQT